MKEKKKITALLNYKRLILSFMALVIIATGFNTFLHTLAFKNNYVNSVISQYRVIGSVLKKKIELSLHFGKKVENFLGMEKLLDTNKSYLTRLISDLPSSRANIRIDIANINGRILYSTEEARISTPLVNDIIEYLASDSGPAFLNVNGNYHIPFQIENWDRSVAAIQVISFPDDIVINYLGTVLKDNIVSWIWILFLSFSMLLLLFYILIFHSGSSLKFISNLDILKNRKFSFSLFLTIAFCQILLSLFETHQFSNHYLSINQIKADTLNLFIKDQIENLLEKGIDLENLTNAEQYIGRMINNTPEFSSIALSSRQGDLLFYSDGKEDLNYKNRKINTINPNAQPRFVRTDTLMKGSVESGTISTVISKDALTSFQKRLLIDSSTIVLISVFFCVEIMILLFINLSIQEKADTEKSRIPTRIIRPVAFIHFFAIDIAISFIPLHMKDLHAASPIPFVNKSMSMSLPVTVQMVFIAVSLLLVGSWCDKKGWQRPFFYGLILSAAGFFVSFLTNSSVLFLISLAVSGFGYGLSYISAQNFVTKNLPPEKKAQGLSEYYAGCIAGSICGVATGGMLAEQIGFASVFLVGFAILAGMSLWAFFHMKPYFSKPVDPNETIVSESRLSFLGFISDRRMLSLLLLNILPASALLVGFMNFFIPVYLQENGISQSDIGRTFLAYGICLIYLAPFLTKRINTKKHSINYITIGGILTGISLLTFTLFSGYTAIILSILFLGIGASFNAVRNAYALNLDISKKIGEGKTSGIIFFLARLGQASGPLVFALFAAPDQESSGIVQIGIIFFFLSIVFMLLSKINLRATFPNNENVF